MLAYILGITKRGNKGITNLSRFYGLQIRARGITNRGSLRDFKSEQKDYKSGRSFKLGQRDLKSGQRLQIGAREITNRGRDCKLVQNIAQQFLNTQNPNTVPTTKSVYEF